MGAVVSTTVILIAVLTLLSEVSEAFKVLKKAMQEDEGFAWGWHCNIAMMCYDSIRNADEKITGATADDTQAHIDAHKTSNDAASRFMKLCFDADNYSPPQNIDNNP